MFVTNLMAPEALYRQTGRVYEEGEHTFKMDREKSLLHLYIIIN